MVTGATGNIGTALLGWLDRRAEVDATVGVARRLPPAGAGRPYERASWLACDLAGPDAVDTLAGVFDGAAAVVHLGWEIITGHRRDTQARTNRIGSRNVVAALVRAGVPQLVHLSSAAVYSPHRDRTPVTEVWPRRGVPASAYSRDKVDVEDMLDAVEAVRPGLRVARVRPPAVLQPAAGSEVVAMMLGRFAPLSRLAGGRVPLLPLPRQAAIQVVAAEDVADLVGRAVLAEAAGPFNAAGEPVVAPDELARLLGGRHVPVPGPALRAVLDASWRLHLQPLDGSWLDLVLDTPLLDSSRARTELGWRAAHDARHTLVATRRAAGADAGTASPRLRPLSRRGGGAGPR